MSGTSRGKRIVVVGAGPGGLTAAMMLASRGFSVTVFEAKEHVGGRNAELRLGPYSFDVGPTFLMMRFVLDEVFSQCGLRSEDYMQFRRLDPMYRIQFDDMRLEVTEDRDAMRGEIERLFPGNGKGYDAFLKREKKRFDVMLPCLQKPYSSFGRMFSADLLRALPRLSLGRSLFSTLGVYFGPDKLKLAFTFQAKYLGMSPWECPAAFAILSYIEHAFGVWHVMGGLCEISRALARAAQDCGAQINLSSPVKRVLVANRKAVGVVLESGERIPCDDIVLNADFGHAMSSLFPEGVLRKYAPAKLDRMKCSCSTFMLYLGVDKLYPHPHHTILLAKDYRANVNDIFHGQRLSSDCSLYLRNATVTDPALAPQGHSALYVLVPVPNCSAPINWASEKERFAEHVKNVLGSRLDMQDLRRHICAEKVITPDDWQRDYSVYKGATFNLAHTISQMLYFRPRNRFEEIARCYLAGGGTHPGSGLPTIIESGRIAANMISAFHSVS